MTNLEPEYVEDPFEEDWNVNKPQQWQVPKSSLEMNILSAVEQTRYHTRQEQKQVLKIISDPQRFPVAWIRFCCTWAVKKRNHREWIKLKGLIGFIHNEDAMRGWLEKNDKNKGKPTLFASMED